MRREEAGLEREEAEFTEAISRRAHRELSFMSGGGSPAFGRHMDREETRGRMAGESERHSSACLLSIHAARGAAHRLVDFGPMHKAWAHSALRVEGRSPLFSVILCVK